ncbi:hypothetical protein C8R43DRAFT_988720 [Mycena crocata]|nr:hypothetical protein C8R43DRAFT_988720 [Mycena crocata]
MAVPPPLASFDVNPDRKTLLAPLETTTNITSIQTRCHLVFTLLVFLGFSAIREFLVYLNLPFRRRMGNDGKRSTPLEGDEWEDSAPMDDGVEFPSLREIPVRPRVFMRPGSVWDTVSGAFGSYRQRAKNPSRCRAHNGGWSNVSSRVTSRRVSHSGVTATRFDLKH